MDWVTSMLQSWGQDRQKLYTKTGYATTSTLAGIFEGTGKRPGHRILCADIDRRSWPVEMIVMNLEPIYCDALVAKYALPPNADGTIFTNRETATRLCLPLGTYNQRVRRARRLFKAKISEKKHVDMDRVPVYKIPLSKTVSR